MAAARTRSEGELLDRCAVEARTLLTNNVGDFIGLAQRWADEGRTHAGLIVTSDGGLLRTPATIGTFIELLEEATARTDAVSASSE